MRSENPRPCFGREHGRNKGEFNSLARRSGLILPMSLTLLQPCEASFPGPSARGCCDNRCHVRQAGIRHAVVFWFHRRSCPTGLTGPAPRAGMTAPRTLRWIWRWSLRCVWCGIAWGAACIAVRIVGAAPRAGWHCRRGLTGYRLPRSIVRLNIRRQRQRPGIVSTGEFDQRLHPGFHRWMRREQVGKALAWVVDAQFHHRGGGAGKFAAVFDLAQRRDHGVGILGQFDRSGVGKQLARPRQRQPDHLRQQPRQPDQRRRDNDDDNRAAAGSPVVAVRRRRR
jgi:hypothetical protein